jgi:acetyl esterase
MPLDPQVKALLDQMAGLPRLEELSVADARKQVERRIAVNLPTLPIAAVLNRTIQGPGGDLRVRITPPMGVGLSR